MPSASSVFIRVHPCSSVFQRFAASITRHAQPTRPRNQPLPPAARGQPRRLVSLGRGSPAARARESDKPILLSIGYSACHWCHVMAHESFEDPEVAEVMNDLFVNVKVDREERPDIDQIYQAAQQMLTQRAGGWPLTMFLTPDQVPFFGGTYFPKEARYGLPGFVDLMRRVRALTATSSAATSRRRTASWSRPSRARSRAARRTPSEFSDAPARARRSRFHESTFDRDARRLRPGAQVPAPGRDRAPACATTRATGDAGALRDGDRRRSRRWPRAASSTSWAAASPLQRGRRLGHPALREDALRQRPAARASTPTPGPSPASRSSRAPSRRRPPG